MIDHELRRLAPFYGAAEQNLHEAARRAYEEPMVPLEEILAKVVARALLQADRLALRELS